MPFAFRDAGNPQLLSPKRERVEISWAVGL